MSDAPPKSNSLRKFSEMERLRAHLALNQSFSRSFENALAELSAKHGITLDSSTIEALVPANPEEIKS